MKPNRNAVHLLALLSLMIAPVPSGLANPPSKALAPMQKVFVPQGFDDNDNVEFSAWPLPKLLHEEWSGRG